MANLFAQAEALAFGGQPRRSRPRASPPALVPHRTFPGNRPTNTILAPRADPLDPGAAHRALRAQGLHAGGVWGINSFDQWGVELGKVLASRIVPELTSAEDPDLRHDSSTNALIRRYRAHRETS